ncbi:MAG TPA: FlgD immunoglobulin-like domain containing protein [Candidatus Eisenbacteria bacterium]|nr:FlgD immunoglobulin-like domain containing protein [Candidatus Eisenbacteria bacterium]
MSLPTGGFQRFRFLTALMAGACAAVLVLLAWPVSPLHSSTPALSDFTNFESLPVHPLALTPDGTRLLACNLPDARLEIFTIGDAGLTSAGEVPVGLEPVSVAALNDSIAWVVDNVSDDVSIVNLNSKRVAATLRVGDEPTDVVLAGSPRRAFVCVSGEDAIKVYSLAGEAGTTLDLVRPVFGRHPRALAARGGEVYVAVLDAGNRTTTLSATEVQSGGGPPPPNPPLKAGLPAPPAVGLIVQKVGNDWVDERPASVKTWNTFIPYDLPDQDVVVLDAASGAVLRTVSGVGTNLFDVAAASGTGDLYVSNTEAQNRTRFEPNLRGRFLRNRLTRIDAGGLGAVTAWHLNAHVVYDTIPGPAGEKALSLAEPTGVAVNPAESKVYVAALGSDLVGVVDPGTGLVTARIPVSAAPRVTKSGPVALALDAARQRLYVLNRFSNSVAVIGTAGESFQSETPLGMGFDPSPPAVTAGRRFLYDGMLSDHGDLACASCHIGGNFDNLAWDLGNPQGDLQAAPSNPVPIPPFHPMKGPMTTQSLRGLANTPPFHWRGDRADFTRFNPAFVSLMGNIDSLTAAEMQQFNDFILTLAYPPNPNQNLDRTWPNPAAPTPSPTRGKVEFDTKPHDGGTCSVCHSFPTGTNGTLIPAQALQESQAMKVPQLRNLYQKTGFTDAAGPQKRGFGFLHDGSMDNLFDFLNLPVFTFANNQERRDLEAFLLAFDTGTAPSVGREITVNGANRTLTGTTQFLDSLYAAADAGQCDLVAHGRLGGAAKGFYYQAGTRSFLSDYDPEGTFPADSLRLLAQDGGEITYLGVPPGAGRRMGIDRDRDGYRDRWELSLGSNPANPASIPSVSAVAPAPAPPPTRLLANRPNPFNPSTVIPFELGTSGRVALRLYNVSGALVRTLVDAPATPGRYEARWDGRDNRGLPVASGRYYARLTAAGETKTRTLTLLK